MARISHIDIDIKIDEPLGYEEMFNFLCYQQLVTYYLIRNLYYTYIFYLYKIYIEYLPLDKAKYLRKYDIKIK